MPQRISTNPACCKRVYSSSRVKKCRLSTALCIPAKLSLHRAMSRNWSRSAPSSKRKPRFTKRPLGFRQRTLDPRELKQRDVRGEEAPPFAVVIETRRQVAITGHGIENMGDRPGIDEIQQGREDVV